MSKKGLNFTPEEISRLLAEYLQKQSTSGARNSRFPPNFFDRQLTPAAVLVPMLQYNGDWNILYTRRNSSLPVHSGQVAFPGGGSDVTDKTPEDTALREAYEEIGINPADVKILGRLPELPTISYYQITAIVGLIPWPYPLVLAHHEVSRYFTIPLAWLADERNYMIRERTLPAPHAPIPVTYFKEYQGETLWGVSAEITMNLIHAIKLIE